RGMRDYMKIAPGQPAGLEEFTAAMTRAAGRDLAPFLKPWVSELEIPNFTARIEGRRLLLTQAGPVFELHLGVELTTASRKILKTIELKDKEQSLDISDSGSVTAIRVDPDHHLLIQRHLGQVLHLELRAPDAKIVEISGDFTSRPVTATLTDGIWKVDLPLT